MREMARGRGMRILMDGDIKQMVFLDRLNTFYAL
jgi:hypothetical protein